MSDSDIILENVFTTEAYRRKGIEIWSVKQLLEKAAACGAARVILFVRDTNTLTRRIVRRLNFVPYLEKTDRRICFLRKTTFRLISKKVNR